MSLKNFSLTDLISSKSEKPGFKQFKKKRVETIKKWVSEIRNSKISSLEDIKKFLSGKRSGNINLDSNVISSILNCKQEGKKIVFSPNSMGKKLKDYICIDKIITKCITNDTLNLLMIANRFFEDKEAYDADLYNRSVIASVKVISDNFELDSENPFKKGFVQDFDINFSAITSKSMPIETVEEVLVNMPNKGEFTYDRLKFDYFGNSDIGIICLQGKNYDENKASYEKAKYFFFEEGSAVEGEKSIPYHENIYYIDKVLYPERFCPTFLTSPEEISTAYFFTYEFEYDALFDHIENSQKTDRTIVNIPHNLCYWDTMTPCFNFLSSMVLLSDKLSDDNKNMLADLCDEYYAKAPQLGYLKKNQMLLVRICSDFLNAFLNNSDYGRFVNLYEKATKYLKEKEEIEELSYYNDLITFLGKIPFADMINNQLKGEVMDIAKDIKNCIGALITGQKPTSIISDIRVVARKILKYTPYGNNETAAFPFVIAPGTLVGQLINFNDFSRDSVAMNVGRLVKKRIKEKNKEKSNIEMVTNIINNSDKMKDAFLNAYLKRQVNRKRANKIVNLLDLKDFIEAKMKTNKLLKDRVTSESVNYASKKSIPQKRRIKVLDIYIDNYISNIKKKTKNENESESESIKLSENESGSEDAEEDNKSAQSAKEVPKTSLKKKKVK